MSITNDILKRTKQGFDKTLTPSVASNIQSAQQPSQAPAQVQPSTQTATQNSPSTYIVGKGNVHAAVPQTQQAQNTQQPQQSTPTVQAPTQQATAPAQAPAQVVQAPTQSVAPTQPTTAQTAQASAPPQYDLTAPTVDYSDAPKYEPPKIESYADIEKRYPALFTEQEKKQKKYQTMLASLSDGMRALANLYYTTEDAPHAFDPSTIHSPKVREYWEKLEASRTQAQQAKIAQEMQAQKDALDVYNNTYKINYGGYKDRKDGEAKNADRVLKGKVEEGKLKSADYNKGQERAQKERHHKEEQALKKDELAAKKKHWNRQDDAADTRNAIARAKGSGSDGGMSGKKWKLNDGKYYPIHNKLLDYDVLTQIVEEAAPLGWKVRLFGDPLAPPSHEALKNIVSRNAYKPEFTRAIKERM